MKYLLVIVLLICAGCVVYPYQGYDYDSYYYPSTYDYPYSYYYPYYYPYYSYGPYYYPHYYFNYRSFGRHH